MDERTAACKEKIYRFAVKKNSNIGKYQSSFSGFHQKMPPRTPALSSYATVCTDVVPSLSKNYVLFQTLNVFLVNNFNNICIC